MRRSGDDEHDILTGNQAAVAVDHRRPEQRPALFRLLDVTRDLSLGHAGIMFECHRLDTLALIVGAANAREGRKRPDVGAALCQRRNFGADVKILALQPDRQSQPPVIGGKNAISRAPAIAASGFTCVWSIAARITLAFSNA